MTLLPSLPRRAGSAGPAAGPAPRRWTPAWSLAALGVLGVVVWGGSALQPGGARLAAEDLFEDAPDPFDLDGDGLHDGFEWVLLCNASAFDTDGDGFGDLEEFARGSAPFSAESTPLPGDIATRMTARQGDGDVHLLLATYVADAHVELYAPAIGLQRGNGDTLLVPPAYVEQRGTLTTQLLPDGGAVQLLELPIRDSLFHGAGYLSLFGTVADANEGTVIVADAIDVRSDTAHLLLRVPVKARPTTRQDLSSSSSSGGSVYLPLPPPGQIPSTWSVGQICRQVSTVVGVVDGVVTREITSADCVEAFQSYCKSDCAQSVGTVEQSVDPLTLIGG